MPDSNDATTYGPFRLEIRGDLAFESAFHIGAGERLSLETDAPILRNAQNELYVPGSSLRGVLQDYLEREASLLGLDEKVPRSLFGDAPGPGKKQSHPIGRLRIYDAPLGSETKTEVRDHVRIEEKWAAAAQGGKFDGEVGLAAGAFAFRAVYEGDGPDDKELILLEAGLEALHAGDLRIGAKSGWGYGKLRLSSPPNLTACDRSTRQGLADYLKTRMDAGARLPAFRFRARSAAAPRPVEGNEPRPFSTIDFHLKLCFEGPVLVKAPIPPRPPKRIPPDQLKRRLEELEDYPRRGQEVADHVFLYRAAGSSAEYLPGSSLRGAAFRSQAFRIARTLERERTAICLFGEPKGEQDGQRGLIEVDDGELDPNTRRLVYLDHVAIDRITAAAIDGKKFSTSALASPVFRSKVRVRFHEVDKHLAAVALWGFVLHDLIDGRLWAGSGTSRGYGYIRRAEIERVECNLIAPPESNWRGLPASVAETNGRRRFCLQHPSFESLDWLWERAQEQWKLNTAA